MRFFIFHSLTPFHSNEFPFITMLIDDNIKWHIRLKHVSCCEIVHSRDLCLKISQIFRKCKYQSPTIRAGLFIFMPLSFSFFGHHWGNLHISQWEDVMTIILDWGTPLIMWYVKVYALNISILYVSLSSPVSYSSDLMVRSYPLGYTITSLYSYIKNGSMFWQSVWNALFYPF